MATIASNASSRPSTPSARTRSAETVLIVLVLLGIATAIVYGGAAEQSAAAVVTLATVGRLSARRARRERPGVRRG
ncbi:hypothetical protein [Streptomyces caelestis]|uniref:hypothetical protein n=1 Tax=Streptomyces caelestis TaxID=36816 RepID=UPI003657DC0B